MRDGRIVGIGIGIGIGVGIGIGIDVHGDPVRLAGLDTAAGG